jgi:hypothetical protein
METNDKWEMMFSSNSTHLYIQLARHGIGTFHIWIDEWNRKEKSSEFIRGSGMN